MIKLNVNGKPVEVDVDPETPLLWVLRDTLGLTGTKFGCGMALCGACTVHLNGQPVRSCQTPILVLPDETPAHPLVVSIEAASLCPNADITVFPWREPPELKARTVEKVRRFLRAHRPAAQERHGT